MSQETIAESHKLVIKRTLAAPVEKVYQAWTDPAIMARWFSPNVRWNAPKIDIDTVVGGRYNITMRHSDGDEFASIGNYVELIPNQRVSVTWTWVEGPMAGDETLLTIDLRPVPEGTELTLTHDRVTDAGVLESASGGWNGCLEMLASYLAGNPPFAN